MYDNNKTNLLLCDNSIKKNVILYYLQNHSNTALFALETHVFSLYS